MLTTIIYYLKIGQKMLPVSTKLNWLSNLNSGYFVLFCTHIHNRVLRFIILSFHETVIKTFFLLENTCKCDYVEPQIRLIWSSCFIIHTMCKIWLAVGTLVIRAGTVVNSFEAQSLRHFSPIEWAKQFSISQTTYHSFCNYNSMDVTS